MNNLNKICMVVGLLASASWSNTLYAQSLQEIQEYCQSMSGDGIYEEDARAYIAECINEQKAFLQENVDTYDSDASYTNEQYHQEENYNDSTYEDSTYQDSTYQESAYQEDDYAQSGQEQNCYTKVDEQIQKLLENDPNAPFDYDQLIDQCSQGTY